MYKILKNGEMNIQKEEKNKMARVQRNIRKHFLITEELDAKLK